MSSHVGNITTKCQWCGAEFLTYQYILDQGEAKFCSRVCYHDAERATARAKPIPENKQCTKCGQIKALCEFHAKKGTLDGKTSRCKVCSKKDRDAKYDPAINKVRCKAYASSHKEEIQAKYKLYYQEHREELIEKDQEYYKTHREERLAYSRKYNKAHPKPYVKPDPISKRRWCRNSKDRLWKEAMDFFGPCACCGESHREFMSVDHINGNGGHHRRKEGWKGAGWFILTDLRKRGWPEEAKQEYRLLCFNCNFAIGHHGYCPHHPEIKYPNQCFKEEKYAGP